jgi:hypothetical protein
VSLASVLNGSLSACLNNFHPCWTVYNSLFTFSRHLHFAHGCSTLRHWDPVSHSVWICCNTNRLTKWKTSTNQGLAFRFGMGVFAAVSITFWRMVSAPPMFSISADLQMKYYFMTLTWEWQMYVYSWASAANMILKTPQTTIAGLTIKIPWYMGKSSLDQMTEIMRFHWLPF